MNFRSSRGGSRLRRFSPFALVGMGNLVLAFNVTSVFAAVTFITK